jgi:hypothetical protein
VPLLQAQDTEPEAKLETITGSVKYLRRDESKEVDAVEKMPLAHRDILRTLENSRTTVWFRNRNEIKLDELCRFQILLRDRNANPLLNLLEGAMYFFSREKPREVQILTPHGTGAPRGTEFVVKVEKDRTLFTMFDGSVTLTNDFGTLDLHPGEQGEIPAQKAQKPPRLVLKAENLVQWWLYYPGVLDVDELDFTAPETNALSVSIQAYRTGDLAAALTTHPGYPLPGVPTTDSGRIYRAALLLAAGQVGKAESLLEGVGGPSSSAASLRLLIAAVQRKVDKPTEIPTSASEWLGLSYYRQARHELPQALEAARRAVMISTNFAFGWERVAELEFGFGHAGAARSALERSLGLAASNAQAFALKGFILSAENRVAGARAAFEESIHLDSSLGNAWLGRGLTRIRKGDLDGGKDDLQTAAILEPNRSLFRSYLGKAFADAFEDKKALAELQRARSLDTNDPTPWLYSALLNQQQNRINSGVRDLEKSVELNDNLSLFHSRLLLDEDRAVRSANLASIYRDAGMNDVSVREAARAVTYDYANDSAHLFLADSYNELRDPTRFNLRYETVWFNELLLANVLAPVGGGRLSQHVSEQEYSRLFEADGLGLANSTLARSDGMLTELASQFGTFGNTGYSLDLDYQHNRGVRPNNDLDSIEWYTTVKQQVTPDDTVLALIKYEDYHSGDNFQYYNPTSASPHFRFDEYQDPIVVGAWHHEWSPGMHTLLLGGHLINEQFFSDKAAPQLLFYQDSPGALFASTNVPFDVNYHSELDIYTVELNQILQWNHVTLSAGGRYQSGNFETQARLDNAPLWQYQFANPAAEASLTEGFERFTGYSYLTLEPWERRLWLTGGLVYDDITYPSNFRQPPISPGEDHRSLVGPKAALVWSPLSQATVRGVFTRSLGGVSLDESFRLEPTQLAGFPQAFRSLISESVVGSVAAPEYETFGIALDLKFPSGTYAGIQAERLESNVRREIGLFLPENTSGLFVPGSTLETLDYNESSVEASVNQLLGDQFVLGARYRFVKADLQDMLPRAPVPVLAPLGQELRAELHETTAYLLFNHGSSGFFARVETQWYHQTNYGDLSGLPGDDFFQENIFAGYRFGHRHVELLLGILNLAGQDYHLHPLTAYTELPRERTFMARLKFKF